MRSKIILLVFLALFITFPSAGFSSDFHTLVMFGDSLSDNGNLFDLQPSEVPATLYYQGRFSNGRVWVEYLAGSDLLDCTLDDRAWGGAETNSTSPPGLLNQVDTYINTQDLADNTLFAIWCGANDFLNGSLNPSPSVANIIAAMEDLADYGAEDILVINLPDLGATPRMVGTAGEQGARNLSIAFNTALATAIDAFKIAHPTVLVYEVDSYAFLHAIIDDPAAYGFTNATQVCPSFSVENNFDNSAGYVFWDDIHPSTETHRLLAEEVFRRLPDSDNGDDSSSGISCFIGSLALP